MGGGRLLALICIACCGGRSIAAGQRVIFVDASAEDGGDGTSWVRALSDLPSALAFAGSDDQIWVAAGTYRAGANRADAFSLKEGVAIFGGFAGNEVPATFPLWQRDLVLNESVLDGEIGAAGPADNAFHVVSASNVSRSAVLDGFTITNGYANGLTLMQQDVGGGLIITNASPTLRHCLFLNHQSGSRGGAVHIAGGSPLFAHCRFVGNRTTVTQAANNLGGAVYFDGAAGSTATPLFVNCLFVGNRAGVGNGGTGGAVYGGLQATATLVNCTLLHNRADTLTGGVFGTATIANSILHGNQDHNGLEPTAQLRGTISASHSLIQGGWPGDGNLNANPMFLDPLGADGLAGTIDDDARLPSGSPCIDAGNNFAWPDDAEIVDLDGAARFMNDPETADTGVPQGAALIDLGAYEKQSLCVSSEDCDDGLFCNGVEFCSNGTCQPGTVPGCTDNVPCTRDYCAEALSTCVHEANDALCDNGLYCDGVEICDERLGCTAGAVPECDDAITCTIDSCDEGNRNCRHAFDHASCDDGIFCNGAEQCGISGCMAGIPPCESESACDEELNQCIGLPSLCLSDEDCNDADLCTDDSCILGACERVFNEAPCDDEDDCTSNDRCQGGSCSGAPIVNCGVPPPPPDPGPGETDPPPVDPPDDDTPPEVGETPESDPDEFESLPEQPEPPAESTSGDCSPGEPCDEVAAPEEHQDSDGDGVWDEVDLCPSTPAGQITDAWGCDTEEEAPGRGTWVVEGARRCGACGAMGSIGGFVMLCVPGTVLVFNRTRGRKFLRSKCRPGDHATCRRTPK